MMECKLYMTNEDIPENKEVFLYGFNHFMKMKVDNYIIIGFES